MSKPEEPQPAPSAVDAFMQELASEGTLESAGSFTLDREVARKKMQRFQLADPASFVLELIQAAVLKGAERIEVHIDTDDLRLRFDGRTFSKRELETLYDAAFGERGDADRQACRQLALGLHAAGALKIAFAAVVSGAGEASVQLIQVPGKPDRLQERYLRPAGTHIHVKYRLTNLGRIKEVISSRYLPEEQLLMARCRFSRTAVWLNDEQISMGHALPDHLGVTPIEGPDCSGVAGWHPDRTGRLLHVLQHGVVIVSRELPPSGELPPGTTAVVESPAFRKDLSQRDVVQNDGYEQIMIHVERALATATRAACLEQHGRDAESSETRKLFRCRCWNVAWTPSEELRRVQTPSGKELAILSVGRTVHRRHKGQWSTTRVKTAKGELTAFWAPRWSELVVADSEPALLIRDGGPLRRTRTHAIPVRAKPAVHPDDEPTDEPASEPPPPPAPKQLFAAFELSAEAEDRSYRKKKKKKKKKPAPRVHAIWAVSPQCIWAVGDRGRVFEYLPDRWQRHPSSTTATLRGVWALSDRCAVAVGDDNALQQFNGEAWRSGAGKWSQGSWHGVWGSSPDNVLAVGSAAAIGEPDTPPQWAVVRYNGHRWKPMELPTLRPEPGLTRGPLRLNAIWGHSSNSVFAVGTRGVILRYDGDQWEPMEAHTLQDLRSVWGTAPDDVYAVGDDFCRLHYNGRAWTPLPPPLTEERVSLEDLLRRYVRPRRVVHLIGDDDLDERIVATAGSYPALCLRCDLPEHALEPLAHLLGSSRVRQA